MASVQQGIREIEGSTHDVQKYKNAMGPRGVIGVIKKELRRRSAIEAVIGHMKTDGHLGRNFLKGRHGDHANVVLTAVGHNLRLILSWLRVFLRQVVDAILAVFRLSPAENPAS